MKKLLLLLNFLCLTVLIYAQDSRLASEYYKNGEYEKAASVYKKLSDNNPRNSYYFSKYVECLINVEEYSIAEKVLKKKLKSDPQNAALWVDYGSLYERQYQPEKAEEMYQKAIANLPKNKYAVTKLANAFIGLTKYDLAIKSYEKGIALLKDERAFAYYLGDLYRRKGESKKMVYHYLNSLEDNPNRMNSLKTIFQRYGSEEDWDELQMQLYDRIQLEEEDAMYPEFLAWLFITKKDYKNALRQLRALDMQFDENGSRVYDLAKIAQRGSDYKTAVTAFQYIVDNKGRNSGFYLDSKRSLLICKREMLVGGFDYTMEDLRTMETEYETFVNEFGRDKRTASIIAEQAELEALFINDLKKAIQLLEEVVKYPGMNRQILAECKIQLADYYLMDGEIWESTLLYSQVDKEFEEDLLGQTARFRNAKLTYYNGDFEYAQGQFEVLKASTSKLIANDALDLSVFISDNLALDTVTEPMMWYAEADMLSFQNKLDEALTKLDSINMMYPKHSLEDDIYYAKAKIYKKRKQYELAEEMYRKVFTDFPEDIRADNSIFELAELLETKFDRTEEATKLYEKILFEYSSSTFSVESRKRYRRLLGEEI